MKSYRLLPILILLVATVPAAGQSAEPKNAAVDTLSESDTTREEEEEGRPGLGFGIATNAYGYTSGGSEQALGAITRWVPAQWLSISATPTMIRVNTPRSATTAAQSSSGLVDLPVEMAASHGFHGQFSPTFSAAFGVSLPVGDSAAGFGSGVVGYSASIGLGLAPAANVWTHLGLGRSLSGISPSSAFGSASGWADLSAGTSLVEHLEGSVGFGSDVGTADPTIGRSSAVSAGLSYSLNGPLTLNATTSHGLSGAAPSWSVGLGFGTAFPYLNHLGSGGSVSKAVGLGSGVSGGTGIGSRRGRP
jgi:hypothetical protein